MSPPPSPWQPPSCFLSLWIWLVWVPHMSGIMCYLSFCDGLFHLAKIRVCCGRYQNFLPFEGWILFHCIMYPILPNYSSFDEQEVIYWVLKTILWGSRVCILLSIWRPTSPSASVSVFRVEETRYRRALGTCVRPRMCAQSLGTDLASGLSPSGELAPCGL